MATTETGARLFGRRCEVRVAVPLKDYAKVGSLVIEVTQLRVQFKVKKSTAKEPNTADITITNLNPERRAQLQQAGGKFILLAGYEDTGVEQLFTGDIRNVSHVREGADWNSLIHSGDGERAYRWARISESFKSGTPITDVLRKLVVALGLDEGNLGLALNAISGQYVHGFVASGRARDEFDRILRSQGFTWSIQDGAVQVLKNDATLQSFIPELGPESGLIGSPEFGASEKNKGPVVKGKCLLQPKLRPGGKLKLNSQRFNGEIRLTKVEHDGDTDAGNWYSDFEGEPI